MVRIRAFLADLRLSLWFVPAVLALLAGVAAPIAAEVDRRLFDNPGALFFLYGGTAEGARSVLSTIAQSMLTFTGLVFTITMLVLQLASSQLSPRVMRTFLRDRGNQVVLGLFVATFVFTLLVLQDVRAPTENDDGFVPGLSIWIAFALLLGSVGAFVWYIDHMAHAIRASTVIANIANETIDAIERLFPERVGSEPDDEPGILPATTRGISVSLKSPRAGVLVTIDEDRLLELVDEADRQLELVPAIGDFVPEGGPLAQLWGDWDEGAAGKVRAAVHIDRERTVEQDAAFGLRQLVDVAVRALSPGTNDPTTAVQALDRIHDLLRRLAVRRIPAALRTVANDRPALLLPRPGWEDYVRLGIDEIRIAGRDQIQVNRRLRQVLLDLARVAPETRLPVIREELALLDRSIESGIDDEGDRRMAHIPSARGHALAANRVARRP